MKNIILGILTMTMTAGCSFSLSKVKGASKSISQNAIPNEFVFKGDKQLVENYLESLGVKASIKPISPGVNAYQVTHDDSVDYDTLAAGLEGQVDYMEPNFKVHSQAIADRAAWPNDRLFFKQWGLNNLGQNPPYGLPGNEDADLDILKAWKSTCGSRKNIVAVIDTGVDYTHPDLKGNMWINEKEAPENGGIAGRDDDGNGLIDDVYGYDFYSGGRTENKYGAPGDPDPMDEDGHGTHCAGSIGAVSGNAQGIAGVNCQVRIMALRFLGAGGGSTVDAVRAIYYAIDKKADVLSNSWGGGGNSKLLRDAIADAEKAGILFVAAAGNDGTNIDVKETFPAAIDKDSRGRAIKNVLTVGASDNQDNPASFSNYGHDHVHVFAPGVHILSTYPVGLAQGGRPYAVMSGTSMATPYVAGVAALILAGNEGLRKKPEQLKQLIMQTVDVKDGLLGKAASNGRVNAANALAQRTAVPKRQNWLAKNQSIRERGYQRDVVDIRHEIKVPGASAVRVHFDFIQVQEPYDSIYLYDKNLRLITHVEETESRDHWSAVIPGDTVTVRFTNSLVRQVTMAMSAPQSYESACTSMGADEIVQTGASEYRCMTDSEDSSSGKTFATFNSEGFSIDRIEYLVEEGAQK